VIARTALGTINHTLLTIEALRSRSILTAGVIMVGAPNRENRDAIERYGCVEVLGEMPRFESLNAGGLAAWATSHLDRNGRLESLLR
jgi:malonyl-CoA O-methyltransferase